MRFIALVLAYTIWTVLGMILWIPFVVRTMTVYMAAVIVSVYRRRDISTAERALNYALGFYGQGFIVISRTLNQKNVDQVSDNGVQDSDVGWALVEVLFALMFWGVTLFALYEFGIRPISIFALRTDDESSSSYTFSDAKSQMSWQVSHWIFPSEDYSSNIELEKLGVHPKNVLVWHWDVAKLNIKMCNAGSKAINGETLYVWFRSTDKKGAAEWQFPIEALSPGSCVELGRRTKVDGQINANTLSGAFSLSVNQDQILASIQI